MGVLMKELGKTLYKYKHIKNDSKLLYVWLYDKYFFGQDFTNYRNEKYIIMTNYEIMDKFNCSSATATRLKKELLENDLIKIVPLGFSKLIKVYKR